MLKVKAAIVGAWGSFYLSSGGSNYRPGSVLMSLETGSGNVQQI